MTRRHKSFTPTWFDRLEDRLTLSHLGAHPALQIGNHHHAAQAQHHHAAQAQARHHHHAGHAQNHRPGPAPPGPGTNSAAPGTAPTAPGTTPTAPETTPTAPETTPTAPETTPTAPETTPSTPGTSPTSPGTTPTVTALVLNGTVEGKGPLDGSGTLDQLGAVTMNGTLGATGADPMNYSGTVTLVGESGSVTLSLSGQFFGPASLGSPIDLTYTITDGTGAFQGATGSGNAVLSFQVPSIIMRPYPTAPDHSFVLSFGDAA